MTREVLEQDDQGNPTVVVYRETQDELDERAEERAEQAARAREIAESLHGAAAAV